MASYLMQRTVHSPRQTLVAAVSSLLVGACLPAAASASQLQANLITVLALGSMTSPGIDTRGDPIVGTDGNFYLASLSGGSTGLGAITQVTPTGTGTALHAFTAANGEGSGPYAGLIQASDGNFYGVTFGGGTNGQGTVFRMALDGTLTTIYEFQKNATSGYSPYAGLVQGPDGALYGTTLSGGPGNAGTVFRLALDGTYSLLHGFNTTDGGQPEGALVLGNDGELYGTTLAGGANASGTIYKITLDGTFTSLYSFSSVSKVNSAGLPINAEGGNPRAGLVLGADGNFYGTTYQGGANGYGTVFKFTPGGAISVVHAFAGGPADGGYPVSRLAIGPTGNLYGSTLAGGYNNVGVIWRLDTNNQYSLLHSLSTLPADGSSMYSAVVPYGGYIYAVSYTDSTYSAGTLFKLDEGSHGVLPIVFAASEANVAVGATITLTWSSPTASSCTASGSWANTIGTSGTVSLTLSAAGIYNYILSCTDAAGVVRSAYESVYVLPPVGGTVDGGSSTKGGGALGLGSLGLLALAVAAKARRRLSHSVK